MRWFWSKLKQWGCIHDVILTAVYGSREQRAKVRDDISQWHATHRHPLVIFPEGCVTGLGPQWVFGGWGGGGGGGEREKENQTSAPNPNSP